MSHCRRPTLAFDTGPLEEGMGLADTFSDGFGLVQARHQNGELDRSGLTDFGAMGFAAPEH
jgi:hypothetical protein